MKEESKLIDAIINLGVGMNELRDEMKGMRKEQQKTNLAIGELRLSYMNLADEVAGMRADLKGKIDGLRSDFNKYATRNDEKVNGHEKRIVKLENSTNGNGGKGMFVAKEPKAEYKTKRSKK